MRPHHEPAEEPLVEVEPAQLWLRQRRLQVRSRSAEDAACTCQGATNQAANQGLPAACQAIDSADLLAGRREVQIVHAGETYRLLVTRNNKLILQK
ncbi:MAG: hemin uptake protein HemP [Planctomycetaceae bacterium]|nr:hemin uptake protein HemP [Planctomycetaceae bacterium]